jgi:hypothetical protein
MELVIIGVLLLMLFFGVRKVVGAVRGGVQALKQGVVNTVTEAKEGWNEPVTPNNVVHLTKERIEHFKSMLPNKTKADIQPEEPKAPLELPPASEA